MARITYVSKAESDYRIYGAPTGYFDDLYEERQRRFLAGASQASKDFFSRNKSIRDKWHGAEAIVAGRKAIAKIGNNLTPSNYVRPLTTKEDFQTARTLMQNLIVAHPQVRKEIKRGNWNGYGIELENINTELYLHARDGVMLIDEEADEISYTQVLYIEGDETTTRFTNQEIYDLNTTYEHLEAALPTGEDYTSVWG